MQFKEKGPFVHAQETPINRPILCPGIRQIWHFCSFPSWKYRESITWFLAKVVHGLRKGNIYTVSACNSRKGQRKVTPTVTGASAMRMGGRQGHVQVDGSGKALRMK